MNINYTCGYCGSSFPDEDSCLKCEGKHLLPEFSHSLEQYYHFQPGCKTPDEIVHSFVEFDIETKKYIVYLRIFHAADNVKTIGYDTYSKIVSTVKDRVRKMNDNISNESNLSNRLENIFFGSPVNLNLKKIFTFTNANNYIYSVFSHNGVLYDYQINVIDSDTPEARCATIADFNARNNLN